MVAIKNWCTCDAVRTAAGIAVFVAVCITIAVVCLLLGTKPAKGKPVITEKNPSLSDTLSRFPQLLETLKETAHFKAIAEKKDSHRKIFGTDGDMLDYLVNQGIIDRKDGLLVTWSHGANKKNELANALKNLFGGFTLLEFLSSVPISRVVILSFEQSGYSRGAVLPSDKEDHPPAGNVMVLEADVNIEGLNTVNETKTPIMAHPPEVYSDNTLQAWLAAALESRKGIKLDFKSLKAVGPSLDILNKTASMIKMNRPVWLNADILKGPNVNINLAINATQFLKLVLEKFPNVTISPGWMTLYVPQLPNKTYTWETVKEMYSIVKNLTQRVTFPTRAVMAKSAWPYFRWLLQMSDRYSLTLWQGATDPVTVDDLLYIRDNNHPEAVYYDIYEPTLSRFKEIAMNPKRKRMFYSGGSLQKFFHPEDSDALLIRWYEIESKAALLVLLQNRSGMIGLDVGVNSSRGDLNPVVYLSNSATELSLENCLDLVYTSANYWGVFLKVRAEEALEPTLRLLRRLYKSSLLLNPVWLNMDVSYGSFSTPGYIDGNTFIHTLNTVFPYVTIAPSWPKEVLTDGYSDALIEDMLKLVGGLWQDISFQLQAVALGKAWKPATRLLDASPCYTITVEHNAAQGTFFDGYSGLVAIRSHTATSVYYKLSRDYRNELLVSIFST